MNYLNFIEKLKRVSILRHSSQMHIYVARNFILMPKNNLVKICNISACKYPLKHYKFVNGLLKYGHKFYRKKREFPLLKDAYSCSKELHFNVKNQLRIPPQKNC